MSKLDSKLVGGASQNFLSDSSGPLSHFLLLEFSYKPLESTCKPIP